MAWLSLDPVEKRLVPFPTGLAERLEVDESLLTGESDPVVKQVGDELLSGSFVVTGAGRAMVDKVGADAYASKLAAEAKRFTLSSSR